MFTIFHILCILKKQGGSLYENEDWYNVVKQLSLLTPTQQISKPKEISDKDQANFQGTNLAMKFFI
jgi:hypothetical protein